MVNKGREKEPDRDMSEAKKHRKAISTTTPNEVPEIKLPKEDVYANVIRFEEEEALKRSANKDADLYMQTCEKFKSILTEMSELKAQGTEQAEDQLREKKIAACFLLTMLKKLNRLDKVRVRHGRDQLQKEKLAVDSNKLQLQNLLYEANHLRREVKQCLQFKSQDEEIDLVAEEAFFADAPESISQPEKTKTDEHVRRLARLEWELHQRKELAVMYRELQVAKESVGREIEMKTSRLQSLGPNLGKLLEATRPLQDALGINTESEWALDHKATLLPRSLYVAFSNLCAYAEVCKELTDMAIIGDEDEAKELDKCILIGDDKKATDAVQDMPSTSIDKEFKDNDDDDEDCENDGQHSKKKHHHRRQNSTVVTEVDIYKPHPLSISFKIVSDMEKGPSLQIIISYLPSLRLVTVQTKLMDFVVAGVATRDILDPRTILNCLVNDDTEIEDITHPKIKYTLREKSIDRGQFAAALQEHQLGKPYTWAQNLCGLNYQAIDQSYDIAQDVVPMVIDRMRIRLKARYQLYSQIASLENKTFNNLLAPRSLNAQLKITCVLAQWSTITLGEVLEKTSIINRFIDEDLITENHLMYHAIIIRGQAKMDCFVNVSPDFPAECPIWAISLHFHGDSNATNSSDIRDMEFWVNSVNLNKQTASTILVLQLKRAMSALDVFVDTESIRNAGSANEHKVDKTFLKIFRTRTRSRPYRIVKNSDSLIYTQI